MATQMSGLRKAAHAAMRAGLALSAAGAMAVLAAQHRSLEAHCRSCAELCRRFEALEEERQQQAQRADLIEYERDHRNLLMKAAQARSLLPVLDTYGGELSPETQSQYLFANALYAHTLHGYRIGIVTLPELHGHLRGLFQSAKVREYWEATRNNRASLPSGSEEAKLGEMVDALLQELDDADTDEWWVVGEAPDWE
ncbi:DUF6082 family protein [Streptomyces sp. E11-3]|uniref:DUF6082 family protein n=1 Tax=Streptomyces sp. E11-3 TaxID=3110112 RepID=UPI00397ED2A3